MGKISLRIVLSSKRCSGITFLIKRRRSKCNSIKYEIRSPRQRNAQMRFRFEYHGNSGVSKMIGKYNKLYFENLDFRVDSADERAY